MQCCFLRGFVGLAAKFCHHSLVKKAHKQNHVYLFHFGGCTLDFWLILNYFRTGKFGKFLLHGCGVPVFVSSSFVPSSVYIEENEWICTFSCHQALYLLILWYCRYFKGGATHLAECKERVPREIFSLLMHNLILLSLLLLLYWLLIIIIIIIIIICYYYSASLRLLDVSIFKGYVCYDF